MSTLKSGKNTGPLPSVFLDQSKDHLYTDSKTKINSSVFKSNDPKKDQIHSKALERQMRFNSESEGFIYTNEFAPGAVFYKYLTNPDPDTVPLKLWVPDTIILIPNEAPRWIYSDAEGNVKESTTFTSQAAKKFRNDNDKYPTILRRIQLLRPRKSNPNNIIVDGSKTEISNVGELISNIAQASAIDQNTVYQRFVKCKTNRSTIYRILFHEHQNIRAWLLMNNLTYSDSANDENGKFIIDLKKDDQCRVFPIQGQDVNTLSEVMYDMVRFVSNRIGRTFSELVCDFIQDENKQWWFLQVKSFLMKDGVPTLSGMEKLQNENSLYLMDHSAFLKKSRTEAEALQPYDVNTLVDSDEEPNDVDFPITANSRKCSDCACCGILYPTNQLTYKMTHNMIKELKNNLKIRCADLQGSWTGLATHLSKKKADKNLSDTAYLYNPLIICKLCYKVYRSEQKLRSISSELARAMGVPAPLYKAAGDDDGMKAATLTNDPGNELITDIPCRDQINILLVPSQLPKKLMMVRFLVIIHTIYDFPEEYIQIDKRLIIRLKILNLQIDLPIDSFTANNVKYRIAESKSDKVVALPVNFMRLFYLLTNSTKKTGNLSESSGLSKFIQSPNLVPSVSLLWEGEEDPISVSKFKLDQFKTDIINKMDQYLLLNIGNYNPQLHITVGIERTGDYNAAHLRNRLQQIDNDIYVPPSNYFSSDPVPEEWVMELPYAGLSCLDKEFAMGIWKNVGVDLPSQDELTTKDEKQDPQLVNQHLGPSKNDFLQIQRSASPVPNQPGRKHVTKLGVKTPCPTSSMAEEANQGTATPSLHVDSANAAELSSTIERREQWPNSIWCLTINCVSARNIPEKLPDSVSPDTGMGNPDPNQPPGTTPMDNGGTPLANGTTPLANGTTPLANGTTPLANGTTDENAQPEENYVVEQPVANDPYVPPGIIQALTEFPCTEPQLFRTNNPNLKDTPNVKLTYQITDITYELDGYPTDVNEIGFKYVHKHYIQGSINSLSRFFHEIPFIKFQLKYPDRDDLGLFECSVDWTFLAEHRCIDGTFDFSIDNAVRPIPSQSYPPYISLAISIYRCGPLHEKSPLPYGLIPWRQYEDVVLLYKNISEEDRTRTPSHTMDDALRHTVEFRTSGEVAKSLEGNEEEAAPGTETNSVETTESKETKETTPPKKKK